MINNQELLFVVNENNQPVKLKLRSVVHQKVLWHRTTGIWVINNRKQILCHKRSLNKDLNPGYWTAFFGGHLAPDEDYQHNAVSEITEELGITVNKHDLILYQILKSDKPTHKEFQGIFALVLDNTQEFQFEKDEIDQLSWKDIKELRSILLDKKGKNWIRKPWDREVLEWLDKITVS